MAFRQCWCYFWVLQLESLWTCISLVTKILYASICCISNHWICIAFKGHQISLYARSDQKYIYSSTPAKPLDRESANPMLPDSGFQWQMSLNVHDAHKKISSSHVPSNRLKSRKEATYFPWAVSPESMIASAPSRTAMAMSDTSALVGVGCTIMLSSIFVATITAFPMLRQILIISSCILIWQYSECQRITHIWCLKSPV
jgi:hypothetical protein